MITRRASCSCGQLSFLCTGGPNKISLCHCFECQRRTSSAYGIAAFFKREDVEAHGATV